MKEIQTGLITDIRNTWQKEMEEIEKIESAQNSMLRESQELEPERQQELQVFASQLQDFFEFTLIDQMNLRNCDVGWQTVQASYQPAQGEDDSALFDREAIMAGER